MQIIYSENDICLDIFGPCNAYNDYVLKTQVKQHQAIVTPGRPCVGRKPFQQSSFFWFQQNKNFDVKVDNYWRQQLSTRHRMQNFGIKTLQEMRPMD